MKKRTKTPRNDNGRSTKEQEAFNRLSESLLGILAGTMKASAKGYISAPVNIGTGAEFTGTNYLRALIISIEKGDSRFIGAKEALTRGYNISGAKADFFLRPCVVKDMNDEDKVIFRSFPLLNLADIKHEVEDGQIEANNVDELNVVSNLLNAIDSVTTLTRDTGTAHLAASKNLINIPPQSQFFSTRLMASTCAHELAHFVARDSKTVKEYASYRGFEEICAETTAFLYCSKQGLSFEVKNAAYIGAWLAHAKTTHTDPVSEAMHEAVKRCKLIEDIVKKASIESRKAA